MHRKKCRSIGEFILLATLMSISILFTSVGFSAAGVSEDGPHGKLDFDEGTSQYLGATDATPTGISYMLCEHWGGNWSDAEKLSDNYEDDLLCWAASASNVLEWTGWGIVSGMWNTDQVFQHFQDHWTDEGSLQEYGWHWWFDGTLPPNWPGWAQVDVLGGGSFWPTYTFTSYYHEDWSDWSSLSAIDSYLHSGYGVGLAVYKDTGGGHAVTCWGYNYNPSNPNDYYGIWVTDSDDYKHHTSTDPPPDKLRYYEISYSTSFQRWHLLNFYGSDNWYIGGVMALEPIPSNRPVADAGGPYTGYPSIPTTFDASGSTDADGDTLKYRWDFDNDGVWDTSWLSNSSATNTWHAEHTGAVVLQVYDGHVMDVDTSTVSILPRPESQITAYAPRSGMAYGEFSITDDIYCKGTNFDPYDVVDIYLVDDVAVWSSGIDLKALNALSLVEDVQIDGAGNLPSTLVLASPLTIGNFDLVADVNQDGVYTAGIDALDDDKIHVSASVFVIPELPFGTLFALATCLLTLGVLRSRK